MKNSIVQINENLFMIKLSPNSPSFNNFICAWLYIIDNTNILIDVGPSTTAKQLLSSLSYLKITSIDYIIITHIHLDHSGAISIINSSLKTDKIICHKSAIQHLKNPEKLWKSSVKTLKKIAELYGPPIPTKAEILDQCKDLKHHNIELIETPGHSAHHISIAIDNYLFIGEAAGVMIKSLSKEIYMRPATPPPFFMKTYLKSLKLLMNRKEETLCYGHLGIIEKNKNNLQLHYEQIKFWKLIIQKKIKNYDNKNKILNQCLLELLKKDPFLQPIKYIDQATKLREFFFIKNSILGFMGDISRKNNF